MAKARTQSQPALEWRVLRWVFLLLFWRLPRLILRALAWLLGAIVGLVLPRGETPELADSFYRSHKWRRLRVDALEANRQRYGMLACECCGMVDVGAFHVDHIYPRSTHPELALDPANLQVLCDACNIGKGTAYTTNWRGGDDPVPARRRKRCWFLSRS
ncbi:MAG: HNH endonuclease [Alphaproteobacteria bacterium]|nr:HNH endonuclease [Alphaproteobacteria bacterium]